MVGGPPANNSTSHGHPPPWAGAPAEWLTRANTTSTNSSTTQKQCAELDAGKLIIDRNTFIIAATTCGFFTCVSVLALLAVLYKCWTRRRQTQAAKAWGRKSRYDQRMSVMRKEIDDLYSRQFSGCLVQEPENPFMKETGGETGPVELMSPETLCEAPAIPPPVAGKPKRKERLTLLFDHGIGLWLPKR